MGGAITHHMSVRTDYESPEQRTHSSEIPLQRTRSSNLRRGFTPQPYTPGATEYDTLPSPSDFKHTEVDEDPYNQTTFRPPVPEGNKSFPTRQQQLEASRKYWEPTPSPVSPYPDRARTLMWGENNRERGIDRLRPANDSRTISDEFELPSTPQSEALIASAKVLNAAKLLLVKNPSMDDDAVKALIEDLVAKAVQARNGAHRRAAPLSVNEVLATMEVEAENLRQWFEQQLNPDRVAKRKLDKQRLTATYDRRNLCRRTGYGKDEFLDASYEQILPEATHVRGSNARYGVPVMGWDADQATLNALLRIQSALRELHNAPLSTVPEAASVGQTQARFVRPYRSYY